MLRLENLRKALIIQICRDLSSLSPFWPPGRRVMNVHQNVAFQVGADTVRVGRRTRVTVDLTVRRNVLSDGNSSGVQGVFRGYFLARGWKPSLV